MPCSLLVTGPPGKGKSVLSNFMVDHLREPVGNSKVIYYFCNIKNNESSRNASAVLRALIVQLCEDRRLYRTLPNRFQDDDDRKSFRSAGFDELWRTFDDLVKQSPYDWIYCVVDGLDVYESGADDFSDTSRMDDFSHKLQTLMDDAGCRLKLFCTSRPDGRVAAGGIFPTETKRIFNPPREDVKQFIREELEKLPRQYNNWKEDIRNSILKRSGGTFLWINIILRRLRVLRFPTLDKVKKEIEKTPRELDELYQNLVQTAFRKDPYDVAILAWIAYAKEPLNIEQLDTATAVMVFGGSSWSECREQKATLDSDTIRDSLGTLVDVINGYLYLIHQSLRDFLRESDIWQQEGVRLRLPRPDLALGKTCMTFLSFDDLNQDESGTDYSDQDVPNDVKPFLSYVSKFWYRHIDSANDVMEDVEKLRRILRGPDRRLWFDRYYWGPNTEIWTEQSLLDTTIPLDIPWLAKLLLDQTSSDLSETFKDSCLVEAARRAPGVLGELLVHAITKRIRVTDEVVKTAARNLFDGNKVMEVLLEKRGDEIQITPEAIKSAASEGHPEVMELLLEKRGDEIQITPEVVEAAASQIFHSRDMIKLLLDKRGDEIQITPEVVKVAARTKIGMMELLLDGRGEAQITPEVVKVAASEGHPEVMELLLEKRGDEIQITPEVVEAAASQIFHSRDMIELLLEKRGNEFQITPEVVTAAASNEYQGIKVMKLLLNERGDEVQITPEVVEAAAENWRHGYEMIELLLEKRGDEVQITPELLKVAAGTEIMTMELLLEERPEDVAASMSGPDGKAVGLAAAGSGHHGTLDLLHRHYHDLHPQTDWDHWAAIATFYNAARDGDAESIQKLLLDGVPPDTKAGMSRTPLWWAAQQGHKAVVELLVGRDDVDTNSLNRAGQGPIFEPCVFGNIKIVELLLDNGADPMHMDEDGRTPASVAKRCGRKGVLRILEQRGIHV